MKKYMKFLAAGMACALVALSFTACGGDTEKKDLLARVKEAGVLKMSTNAQFPPFESTGDNGKVVGVDVDIAQAIADKIGVKLEVKDGEFNAIISELQTGKSDIGAAGMTITEERSKQVDFSDSYFTSIQYIITKEGAGIQTIEDLGGKRVGVQLGTTGDIIMDEANNGAFEDGKKVSEGVLESNPATVSQMKSAIEATQDLINGRLDAVVIDKLPAENLVKQNSGKGLTTFELVFKDGSKTDEQYAIAVPKGEDAQSLLKVINEVIAELKANGKMEQFIIEHTK